MKQITTFLIFIIHWNSLSGQIDEGSSKTIGDSISKQKINLHFQSTYIYQYKPSFHSAYSGAHSLQTMEEKQNSLTSTLFLGARLWKGGELYFNPEIAGGAGLSGTYGMAASSNGETYRVGNPAPELYLARFYLSQTFALGNEHSKMEDGANQLNGIRSDRYLQFLLGKISLGDIFDNNTYSNSPRTQFMNWAIMNNAAWDYAANVRGYTLAFAAIIQTRSITYKAAIAMLPIAANGAELNTNLNAAYSINAELVKKYMLSGKKGTIRCLGYYNYAPMGSYTQALNNNNGTDVPYIISTRQAGRNKAGVAMNMEQKISENLGTFCRFGWNDGKTETWCYTESDYTLCGGINISGNKWKRETDNMGIALVVNGLSDEHKNYLAAGGLGFELGDGKLNYRNEAVTEMYYSCKPLSCPLWISVDYQFVNNPGYNKDRGPVNVFSLRLHVEL